MKVEAIIEARIGKIDEVVSRKGHLLGVELDSEAPHGGVDSGVLGHDYSCGEGVVAESIQE